jgi:hypothetical protein
LDILTKHIKHYEGIDVQGADDNHMKTTVMSTENKKTDSLSYKKLTKLLYIILNSESNLSISHLLGRNVIQYRLTLEHVHSWIRIGALTITTSFRSIIRKIKLILHNEKTMVMK